MKLRHLLLISALGWTSWASAQAPAPLTTGLASSASPMTLQEALQAARNNSDVKLATQALRAAQADIAAADHAPSPTLTTKATSMDLQKGLGPGNVLTQKRIDKSIGVDWTWERGNKRQLRTQAATQNASAAQADVYQTQIEQQVAVIGAYYDLLAAQSRLAETQDIQRSMDELAKVTALRLKAGDISEQDAARTQIEAERARTETQAAQLNVQQSAIALAQLTASPVNVQARSDEWPATIQQPAMVDLQALAESSPDVRAALARVTAAQAAMQGAQSLRKADVTWGVSLDHFPGTSNRLLEVRAQIPLNWGYRFEGEIGRAQAQLSQAEESLDKTRRLAITNLQALQQGTATAAQRALSFDNGIIPRAELVARNAELAYKKGALGLTDLLDARRTLKSTLLDAISARQDYAKARAEWDLRTNPATGQQ